MRSAFQNDRLLHDFGPGLTNLKSTVARHDENDAADVAKVQSLLLAAGETDLKELGGPTGIYSDRHLEEPIKRFQREHGLKVDALVKPGGLTIRKLGEVAQHGGSPLARPTNEDRNNARFNKFRGNLAPREGGLVDLPNDPGGRTDRGISKKLLDTYRAKFPEKRLPADPAELSDEQVTAIYRDEFYNLPHIGKLATVPGLDKASSKLAEQIFDSGTLHGPEIAGKWLQQSLDRHLGTNLRTKMRNRPARYDGIIGSKTRAAVERAIREGKISVVNDTIVEMRKDSMLEQIRRDPTKKSFEAGWLGRAESFRQGPSIKQ